MVMDCRSVVLTVPFICTCPTSSERNVSCFGFDNRIADLVPTVIHKRPIQSVQNSEFHKKVLSKSLKSPEKVLRKVRESPWKVLSKSWENPEKFL